MTRLGLVSAFLTLTLATPASALDGWRAQGGDSILSPHGERIRLLGVDTRERNCRCERECSMAEKALPRWSRSGHCDHREGEGMPMSALR